MVSTVACRSADEGCPFANGVTGFVLQQVSLQNFNVLLYVYDRALSRTGLATCHAVPQSISL